MSKHPFNLPLPDGADKVMAGGVHIGWAWPCRSPLYRLEKSKFSVGRKYERWAICSLDGEIASRNSRTRLEAERTLKRFLARRVGGNNAHRGRYGTLTRRFP